MVPKAMLDADETAASKSAQQTAASKSAQQTAGCGRISTKLLKEVNANFCKVMEVVCPRNSRPWQPRWSRCVPTARSRENAEHAFAKPILSGRLQVWQECKVSPLSVLVVHPPICCHQRKPSIRSDIHPPIYQTSYSTPLFLWGMLTQRRSMTVSNLRCSPPCDESWLVALKCRISV